MRFCNRSLTVKVTLSQTGNNDEEYPDYEACSSDEHESPSVDPPVVSGRHMTFQNWKFIMVP